MSHQLSYGNDARSTPLQASGLPVSTEKKARAAIRGSPSWTDFDEPVQAGAK
jgi:hypothetical protein